MEFFKQLESWKLETFKYCSLSCWIIDLFDPTARPKHLRWFITFHSWEACAMLLQLMVVITVITVKAKLYVCIQDGECVTNVWTKSQTSILKNKGGIIHIKPNLIHIISFNPHYKSVSLCFVEEIWIWKQLSKFLPRPFPTLHTYHLGLTLRSLLTQTLFPGVVVKGTASYRRR